LKINLISSLQLFNCSTRVSKLSALSSISSNRSISSDLFAWCIHRFIQNMIISLNVSNTHIHKGLIDVCCIDFVKRISSCLNRHIVFIIFLHKRNFISFSSRFLSNHFFARPKRFWFLVYNIKFLICSVMRMRVFQKRVLLRANGLSSLWTRSNNSFFTIVETTEKKLK